MKAKKKLNYSLYEPFFRARKERIKELKNMSKSDLIDIILKLENDMPPITWDEPAMFGPNT